MKKITGCFKEVPHFWVGYLLFSIFLFLYCLLIEKGQGFILINQLHNLFFDRFFTFFTNVGNGIFIICIALFCILRRKTGLAIQITLGFLLSGLMVQIVKHCWPSPRPRTFFGNDVHIHLINGVTGTGSSSFPSGHTASIFSMAVLLSLYSSRFRLNKASVYFLALAILTGYSRIYLSQHFPIDVLVGSLVGVIVSLAVFVICPFSIFEDNLLKIDLRSVKLR